MLKTVKAFKYKRHVVLYKAAITIIFFILFYNFSTLSVIIFVFGKVESVSQLLQLTRLGHIKRNGHLNNSTANNVGNSIFDLLLKAILNGVISYLNTVLFTFAINIIIA